MCGIAGIFAYHTAAAPVDRVELRAIRDHMAARGPDGFGEWYSDNNRVGLGHRRLSIIDLSDRAAQPMASSDGQIVISFNGEIYNYRALRKELEARGRTFRTGSDTEVLLHLYAEKGEAMLHDLRGMFAFALWDTRKQALFLARDPFGIKPLYYANNGKTFRFASQVKALLAGGQIDTTPEPAGHAGFFLWGSVPEPWTLYRGIRALPAGHGLWITQNGASETVAFCRVHDMLANAAANPAQGSRDEALEVISAALRNAIEAHLVSDVPVGMFLSAGLDSAMITALVADMLNAAGERPHTLTLAFADYADTPNDEAPMAEMLAAQLGTRHATVMVRREDYEEEREKLLAAMDQPSIDGVNTWFVARAAASQGIKVALSGVGGDELFASYPSFVDLPRITRLAHPFGRLPGLGKCFRQLDAPFIARHTSPKFASLLEYGCSLGGAYLLRRGLYMPWELPQVMDADMAAQGCEDLQTLRQLDELARPIGSGASYPQPPVGAASSPRSIIKTATQSTRLAISALEMSCYMRNQLLRDSDWASMAHSLEIRVPCVDVQLLQTIAPWLAAHPQLSKSRVVAAATQNLPGELLNKPKTGFSVPVRQWLLQDQSALQERGMRGWARFIHQQHTGNAA